MYGCYWRISLLSLVAQDAEGKGHPTPSGEVTSVRINVCVPSGDFVGPFPAGVSPLPIHKKEQAKEGTKRTRRRRKRRSHRQKDRSKAHPSSRTPSQQSRPLSNQFERNGDKVRRRRIGEKEAGIPMPQRCSGAGRRAGLGLRFGRS